MTTPTKIICFVGASVLILVVGFVILESTNRPTAQVAFSCLGVSNSSNISSISISITNQSASTIVYYAAPPQLKSNGVWNAFQFPLGKPLATLAAGQSSTAVVTTPLLSGEFRVPILWGFDYSVPATKWQEIKEDVITRLDGRNPGGRGSLYTNYVTGIRP